MQYRTWREVSNVVPGDNRSVFTWTKATGISYNSAYNTATGMWNLPWQPTHWMERPDPPEEE